MFGVFNAAISSIRSAIWAGWISPAVTFLWHCKSGGCLQSFLLLSKNNNTPFIPTSYSDRSNVQRWEKSQGLNFALSLLSFTQLRLSLFMWTTRSNTLNDWKCVVIDYRYNVLLFIHLPVQPFRTVGRSTTFSTDLKQSYSWLFL